MFYNTTHEKNPATFSAKAESQDAKIERIFTNNPDVRFTASEVWKYYFDDGTPLTSVRRALNTLLKSGVIEETGRKREGLYGRPTFEYRLKKVN